MSYHRSGCGQGAPVDRLTEQQLDRWSDTASFNRFSIRDNRTLFVQNNTLGTHTGQSFDPIATVVGGVGAASNSGGDILMIRNGTYPENFTITKRVTLRVPHGHVARIGN